MRTDPNNRCKQCGADISTRSARAIYCFPCSVERNRSKISPLPFARNLTRKRIDGQLVCVDCHAPLKQGKRGAPMRCHHCACKRYHSRKSAQGKCWNAVAKAIKHGLLKRPAELKCVDCSNAAEVYDHRNYSKPLEVEPVCRACNINRGHANDYEQLGVAA